MSPLPAASAATSESEDSAADTQQNGAKKRKRLMTISYVISSSHRGGSLGRASRMRSNELINDMDSCELCKLRKVKCGKSNPCSLLSPSENGNKTESSRRAAGVLAMTGCANTKRERSLGSALATGVNSRAASTASKHSSMHREPSSTNTSINMMRQARDSPSRFHGMRQQKRHEMEAALVQ